MTTMVLDDDLQSLRPTLHQIDDDKLFAIQERRNARELAARCNGRYALTRMLNGLLEDNPRKLAPYEFQCSERIAEELGRAPRPGHLFVPVSRVGRRDLTAGVAGSGGFLVQTDVAPGDLFVEYLHASSVLARQRVSQITLRGNASVPRVSGKVSAGWLSTELSILTESQFAFAVTAASPKSVGAYCEVSNQFLRQTSEAAQAFVLREMARATAAEFDAKCFTGTGAAGEPTGLLNVSGLGSVSGTSLAYTGVLDAIKNVETVSGLVEPDRAGFVIAPDAARLLRARERAAGSGLILTANDLAGYLAQVTKSVPDGALVFGDWSQLMVVNWGILEVGTDPYGANSTLFKTGLVGIRSIWTCDLIVLHAESFQKITGIT